MTLSTADLYDAYGDDLQIAEPIFQHYGGPVAFSGQVVTVKVYEDNSLVRQALEEPGHGRILVIDGGGSKRCALVGDVMADLALKNGWKALLINGCVRDSRVLAGLSLSIRAIATTPRKSVKRGEGERGMLLTFAGVTVHQDDWIYADEDGIVISSKKLEITTPEEA